MEKHTASAFFRALETPAPHTADAVADFREEWSDKLETREALHVSGIVYTLRNSGLEADQANLNKKVLKKAAKAVGVKLPKETPVTPK
jgi:hypothetical protein